MGSSPDALLQPHGPSCCSLDHSKHSAASGPVAEAIPLPKLHFFTTPQGSLSCLLQVSAQVSPPASFSSIHVLLPAIFLNIIYGWSLPSENGSSVRAGALSVFILYCILGVGTMLGTQRILHKHLLLNE